MVDCRTFDAGAAYAFRSALVIPTAAVTGVDHTRQLMFGVYRVNSAAPIESPAGLVGTAFLSLTAVLAQPTAGANAMLTKDGTQMDGVYLNARAVPAPAPAPSTLSAPATSSASPAPSTAAAPTAAAAKPAGEEDAAYTDDFVDP